MKAYFRPKPAPFRRTAAVQRKACRKDRTMLGAQGIRSGIRTALAHPGADHAGCPVPLPAFPPLPGGSTPPPPRAPPPCPFLLLLLIPPQRGRPWRGAAGGGGGGQRRRGPAARWGGVAERGRAAWAGSRPAALRLPGAAAAFVRRPRREGSEELPASAGEWPPAAGRLPRPPAPPPAQRAVRDTGRPAVPPGAIHVARRLRGCKRPGMGWKPPSGRPWDTQLRRGATVAELGLVAALNKTGVDHWQLISCEPGDTTLEIASTFIYF